MIFKFQRLILILYNLFIILDKICNILILIVKVYKKVITKINKQIPDLIWLMFLSILSPYVKLLVIYAAFISLIIVFINLIIIIFNICSIFINQGGFGVLG